MKNLYKTIKSWLCVLLAATMLYTDTGMIVFAAEEMEQDIIAEAMKEILLENISTSETPAEEVREDEDEEKEIEISEGNSNEEDTEEGETGENLVTDPASEETTDGEDGETLEEVSTGEEIAAEEENDIEDVGKEAEDLEKEAKTSEDYEEDIIASGEYKEDGNDITWVIDADGRLTVEGTGEFSSSSGYSRAPWYGDRESVKYAEVNVIGMTNASNMFRECSSLSSIDLGSLDTSNIIDMKGMFSGCSSLKNIDLSSFDTRNVTNMCQMFQDCGKLTSVDVSSFNTGKVTDMSAMFNCCRRLENLDLSNFDTSSVADMGSMFHCCDSLKSLDLSSFDTSNVTDMSSMFEDCRSLESLGLSSFDTSNVTDMSWMFNFCSSLESLDLSNFDTSNVTDMRCMFEDCRSLESLNLSSFDISNVTSSWNIEEMFANCISLTSLNTPYNVKYHITLPNSETKIWVDEAGNEYEELPRNLDYSILIKKNEIPLIVSAIKVNKTRIIYKRGDDINVDDLTVIYYDADGIEQELESSDYTTNVAEIDMSIEGTKELVITYGELTSTVKLIVTKNDIIASGECGDVIWVIDADGKLTVEGTGGFGTAHHYSRAPWYDQRLSIKSAEINVTGMTDASYMFSDCQNLTSLNMGNFDTSSVKYMDSMFISCNSLESLDVGNFDTRGVEDMRYMFSGCRSLESLDLSNFGTSIVTDMDGMFNGCSSLESLDVGNFDTKNVFGMDRIFSGCSSLKSLDLSGFDISNMDWGYREMFPGCFSLATLHTPYNVKCQADLPKCASTDIWIDESGNKYEWLPNDLDYSILLTKKSEAGEANNITWAIDADGKLTVEGTGDFVSSFDDEDWEPWYRVPWYSQRRFIKSAEINVAGMTDASYMFYGCSSLERLNLSNFDTSNVTDMREMFYGCSSLKNLDLSNFGTSNVTDMSGMFEHCYSLESLDLSNFDTSNVTSMREMFYGCSSLKNLNLSNFGTSNVTDMSWMFAYCSSLKNLDLSNFDTSNVTDMWNMDDMFHACTSLTSLHTPYNVKCQVTLPKSVSTDIWIDEAGNEYEELPQNLDHSILLIKTTESSPGSIILSAENTIITLSDTYDYVYDGQPKTPEVTVTYTVNDTSVVLEEGIDYSVIYENNINVFENSADMETIDHVPLVIIVGRNRYSGIVSKPFYIYKATVPGIETVAVPVANPESERQLPIGSPVTLTCETAGAQIYYTTSANAKGLTDPTEADTKYTSPIIINTDIHIRAVAIKGSNRSKFIDLHYTAVAAEDKVLKPYAVPGQGAVAQGTRVELKCDTPDAVIYYAAGGNADMLGAVPADDAHRYTSPIEISRDMSIKAVAVKDGMQDSDFSTFVYRISVAPDAPAAEPASGTVDRGSYISLKTDSGVNIYYTTDQSDPRTSETARLYESRIRVDGDSGSAIVIKAAAEKKGIYSEVVTFTYTVSESTVKGLQVMLAGGEEFIYTGRAIKPAVIVTNNGEELTEGEDYTVKYGNNVIAADKSAKKAPKITVTGKGNLTKSTSITFTIKPKYIGDEEEVVGGNVVAVSGKTASPILFYDGVKLTAKDFDNPNAKKKYDQDETITITGKGNFEGTRDIDVRVVDKKDVKKFTVVIDQNALKREPLVYDGEPKTLDDYFTVYDTADKAKSNPLEEYSDYAVIYPKNNIDAGKVKFTVVGLGEYAGTVTKSYTIKPRVVKTQEDGCMNVNVNNGDAYPFTSGGVTIPDLTVTCDGEILALGRDYRVTYSNNKKICANNKAKCTISFTGNYKGSKALVRGFNITAAVLDDVDQINEAVSVAVGDKVYTGKRGAYKSIPYVTANGVLLKSSDYKVSYYKDVDREQVIDGRTAAGSVDLTDLDKQTVYVKIEGKGNYEGTLTAEYNVYKLTGDSIDLAKAKVTIVGGNKAVYTGEGIRPDIEIKYKADGVWKTVDADDIGTYVAVTCINNVNKGKATVMINGSGRYVGSKTVTFSIVSKSMR